MKELEANVQGAVDGSDPNGSLFVGTKEMATRMGSQRAFLFNLVYQSRVPHVHFGRRLAFIPRIVIDWFEQGGDETQGLFNCPVCAERRRRKANE